MNQQNNGFSSTVTSKIKKQSGVVSVTDQEEKNKAAQLPCSLCGMEDKHNSGLWQSVPEKLKALARAKEVQEFVRSHCGQGIKNLQKDAGQAAAFDDITDSQLQEFIKARRRIRISKDILHATKADTVEDWIKKNGQYCPTCGEKVKNVHKRHREGWLLIGFDVYTCKRCVVLLNEYETKDKQKRLTWLNSRMAAVEEARHYNLDIKFVLRHDLERCEHAILNQKGICPLCSGRVDDRALEDITKREQALLGLGNLRVCKSCNSKRDISARSSVGDADEKKKIRDKRTENQLRGIRELYENAQKAHEIDVLKHIAKGKSLDKLSWLKRLMAERMALQRGMVVDTPGCRESVYAAIVATLREQPPQSMQTQAEP